MIKFKNNGLEIKSRYYHSFVQKPQTRNIYVDDTKYHVPLPYLIFIKPKYHQKCYIYAFEYFMLKNNKLKYDPNNPPYALPLPNINSNGFICLGDYNYQKGVYGAIQAFYGANFDSKEIFPTIPQELESYQPLQEQNFLYKVVYNKIYLLPKTQQETLINKYKIVKSLMEFSIQRNSFIFEELKIHERINPKQICLN